MKRLKFNTYLLLLLSVVLTGSCTNLDEEWYSEVTPSTFYTSKENIYSALYRPFTHARWFVENDRWRLQEYTTDEFAITTKGPHWYNGGENERYHYHKWTVNDGWVSESWRGATMGIALALDTKQDLEKLDYAKFKLTAADKDAHLMQLQTLIAYFYLRALDYFGGMPIFTSNEGENMPRNTDQETFDHIEKLLKEAIPKLTAKQTGEAEEGALKQAAAATMLAQLYFNAKAYVGKEMYTECAQICQDIIDGKYGHYELDQDWFGPHDFDNDKSPEIIWCTPSHNAKLTYNWFWSQFYHYETYKYLDLEGGADNGAHLQPSRNPQGQIYSDFKLGKPYEKFNDQDLRKKPYFYKGGGKYEGMFLVGTQTNPKTGASTMGTQEYKGQIINFVDMVATFKKVGTTEYPTVASLPSRMSDGEENTGIRLIKVPQPNLADKTIRNNADNPVIRLAEVYYMLAECKLRAGSKGEAATLINKVRERNFIDKIDPDPVTADNLDKYRMLDEWMIEFLGEGRRRTDLIRWDMFVTEKWWDHEPSNKATLNRFPVPASAISGNNALQQNPGYE
jgi:hypothetical protein